MSVKTRFAPSPTGFLHVGGARTALFSWLYARKNAGKFVLRIEDTDQVRSTAESAAGILQDMLWLGLNWDEGPVVGGSKNEYFQSERLPIYNRYLDQLIAQGRAYEAYESPAQLTALRQEAEKAKRPFRYRRNMPGRVLEKQPGINPVLRFEMPFKDITLDDLVLGPVTVQADEHDDIVIRKSDGFPTYHFAVVIDDHEMGVTHVLRAQEHLMNTFKHLGLYEAFGWTPAHHGHLPLVFNMDGTKMSKREKAKVARAALQANVQKGGGKDYSDIAAKAGVTLDEITPFMAKKNDDANLAAKLAGAVGAKVPEIDVQDFRRSGYLPEALLNFIALVGWAPGEDREIITQQQMIELFSVEGIGKTNGRFDRKKLEWMNGEYIRKASIDRLLEVTKLFLAVTDYSLKNADDATLRDLLAMYQERMVTLSEMAENARFFFEDPVYDAKAVEKHIKNNNGLTYLAQIRDILAPVTPWTKDALAEPMERVLTLGEKKGAAAQAFRVAVSGGAVSPPMLETVALLGREKTLARIERMLVLSPSKQPVVAVNNRGRGFARLGPETDPINRGIRTAMEQRGYESEIQDGDIWLRYQPRRTGGFPIQYARLLTTWQASLPQGWDTVWTANVHQQYDNVGEIGDIQQCRQMLAAAAGDPNHKFLYWLDATLILCRREDRATFLRQDFMPAFSARFPTGRVIFIGTEYGFESRIPLLRIGNYLQINGRHAFEDMRNHGINSPQTANALHTSGVITLDTALMALLGNFLPLRTNMVGGKMGLRVIYFFGHDTPPVIDRGNYPREEIELQIPQFFLRGDDPVTFTANPADPIGGWSGRYRNLQYLGDDAVADLITFFLRSFNLHVDNRLEVCNFTNGDDIDFISAFEKYLTIDRILLECIMVATSTNAATARLMTFAVLDKFQELCSFPGIQQERNFHYMCTRKFLNDVLLPSFGQLPDHWANFFRTKASTLYDDLYSAVMSVRGVWPNFLVKAGEVSVYRSYDQATQRFVDRDAPLSHDDFVAEYIRAARNTHHGYVSDGDKRRRFACFGSISTAFLPDSFTQLPLLIVLAEMINPRLLSGHHWIDQAALNPI